MKKIISLFLVFILLVSILCGCGASGNAMDYGAPEAEAPAEKSESSIGTDGGSTTLPANRKLIRTVRMEAQTQQMDELLPNLESLITSLGGYLESREIYSNSSSSSQWRNAHMTIRIPSDKADIFLGQMENAANVTSISEDLEDVTLDYVATESRIKALETEQARLLELMEQAENLTDLLEIEARLTDVVYELENYGSQLRLYDNLIDYTTIHLSVYQVTELTTPEDEMTIWQRIGTGFMSNLKGLGETLEDIFVWLIVSSPVLLLLALIVVALIFILRKVKVRKAGRKTRRNPIQPDDQPQT